jgi:hypothetical protein
MIAVLVLSPEGLGAVYAAMQNRLQRAINITLGSALATVSLTIPAVLVIGILTDRLLTLGLQAEEMVLLFLTIIAAMLTFGGARTNLLQGLVQLVLFLVFLALLFDPEGKPFSQVDPLLPAKAGTHGGCASRAPGRRDAAPPARSGFPPARERAESAEATSL